MNYLTQVQRGIDYIEANLDFDIELMRVSKVAGISHWHFQRIFKALTGETLKTYIRSRRLANSLDSLLLGDDRILDIALRAGFETQESFTRAFKSAFGVTPNQYRKIGNKGMFLKKVQFDTDYLRHIHRNVSLTPKIVEQPAMTLVGLRTRFYSVDSDKNNIGDKLPPLWQAFLARRDEIEDAIAGVNYGVVRQASSDDELLEYEAAIAVKSLQALPPGMVRVQLPAACYAIFTHQGPAKDIDHTVNYIYSTWLAQSGKRHTYAADLEIYDAQYHPTSSESVMYYGIPIT